MKTPITGRSVRRVRRIRPGPLSLLALTGAIVLALCGAALAPARGDAAPPPRTVSAWLPYWDQEGAYQDALVHADQLRTISPFWYEAKSATRIDGYPGAGERRIIDGLHAAGIQVVPTVMEQMEPGALAAIVTSPDRRAEHITELLALVRSRAYDGIDLDYETVAATGDATYRTVGAGYTALVRDLCSGLHALGKVCFATVTPKTTTTGRIWDYRSLGQVADRVRIMAYNLHHATGTPGPLSSTAWYDEILRRATAEIPVDRIELGLPAYGWDWAEGSDEGARHVTSKEAEALREAVGAPYGLDPASQTPHFTYKEDGTVRTVWYQDARGTESHLPVLRRYGVRNTALWALDFEDPGLWAVLSRGA
ncbi:glycosyl hydrolase family 18 protein [Streptomyces sp. NBC_01003]|uniref:glycosyl hydrolase family 18 protein n=1 Tax=Streptomyces sp. NBC_01003 TaxID=2903714 RepID=UPI00386B4517|nr:glycosyl hydrolase family 18 protein [Streptomyces sp. NBC_01003]